MYNEHYELLHFGSMDGTPMIMDGVDEGSRFTTIVYRDKNKQVFSVTLKHGQRTARKLDDGETETLFNKDELIRQTIMDTQEDVESILRELEKIDGRLYELQKKN